MNVGFCYTASMLQTWMDQWEGICLLIAEMSCCSLVSAGRSKHQVSNSTTELVQMEVQYFCCQMFVFIFQHKNTQPLQSLHNLLLCEPCTSLQFKETMKNKMFPRFNSAKLHLFQREKEYSDSKTTQLDAEAGFHCLQKSTSTERKTTRFYKINIVGWCNIGTQTPSLLYSCTDLKMIFPWRSFVQNVITANTKWKPPRQSLFRIITNAKDHLSKFAGIWLMLIMDFLLSGAKLHNRTEVWRIILLMLISSAKTQ